MEGHQTGEFPEELLQAEATRLHVERERLARESEAARRDTAVLPSVDEILDLLPAVVESVASWVRAAEGEDLGLLLRALNMHVRANRERAVIGASVPLTESLQNQNLLTTGRTSASPFICTKKGGGLPLPPDRCPARAAPRLTGAHLRANGRRATVEGCPFTRCLSRCLACSLAH